MGIFRFWFSLLALRELSFQLLDFCLFVSKQQFDILKIKISLVVGDQTECSAICKSHRMPSENNLTHTMNFN